MFKQFCIRRFSIRIIQYRLNVDLIQWCRLTVGKVSRFDNGYLPFGPIYTNLVISVSVFVTVYGIGRRFSAPISATSVTGIRIGWSNHGDFTETGGM